MMIFSLFVLLLTLLSLSVPIGIAIGVTTVLTLTIFSQIPTLMVAQNAFAGLDSFPLMAIPFFILAGNLMRYGGISRRLLDLADTLVGHLTGGLAMVTTLACMFFGAISGSANATVSAIGSFMIPEMRDKNYPEGYAAALTAAAGSIGVIIPPSIPFVIYGVVTGTSIGALFIAGIIPGILMTFLLMLANYIICKKHGYRGKSEKASFKMIMHSLIDAIWAILVPVIILGGIYGGVFTPTEAAVVAAVYAVIIGCFVYKELDLKNLYASFRDTMLVNGAVTFILGLSVSFAHLVTMKQVPALVGKYLINLDVSPFVILILINIFLLIVGCFIDNISSCVILAPIFLPVVMALGVDPIHFGIFLTINLSIGFVTPPYGSNLFIASAISGISVYKIYRFVWPLILAMMIALVFVTYIPQLSMFLPGLFQ